MGLFKIEGLCQWCLELVSILKENITLTVRNLPPEMLHSAVESTVYRMQGLVQENGAHIEPNRCLPRESDSTE